MEAIWVKWSCSRNQSEFNYNCCRWVHCSHKGMDMVSNNIQVGLWRLYDAQVGPQRVFQENISHTITTPPPAWTVETRQDGSMLSCSWSECRSRNRDSSDQETFSLSFIVQFWWACANCSLRFLFLTDKSGIWCGLCCCSSSAPGFDVLCVQRWYSAYLGCNKGLFELLLPFYHLWPVCPFSSDLWHQQGILSTQLPLTGYFFLNHSL